MDSNQYLLGRKCHGRASFKDPNHFRVNELKVITTELGLSSTGVKDVLCNRIRDHLNNHPDVNRILLQKYGKENSQKIETVPKPRKSRRKPTHQTSQVVQKIEPVPKPHRSRKRLTSHKTEPEPEPEKDSKKIISYLTLEDMMKEYNIPNMRSLIDLTDEEIDSLIQIIKLHDGQVKMTDVLKNITNKDEKIKVLVDELSQKLCRCVVDKNEPRVDPKRVGLCISSIFHSKGIRISGFNCFPKPILIPKNGSHAVIMKKK